MTHSAFVSLLADVEQERTPQGVFQIFEPVKKVQTA